MKKITFADMIRVMVEEPWRSWLHQNYPHLSFEGDNGLDALHDLLEKAKRQKARGGKVQNVLINNERIQYFSNVFCRIEEQRKKVAHEKERVTNSLKLAPETIFAEAKKYEACDLITEGLGRKNLLEEYQQVETCGVTRKVRFGTIDDVWRDWQDPTTMPNETTMHYLDKILAVAPPTLPLKEYLKQYDGCCVTDLKFILDNIFFVPREFLTSLDTTVLTQVMQGERNFLIDPKAETTIKRIKQAIEIVDIKQLFSEESWNLYQQCLNQPHSRVVVTTKMRDEEAWKLQEHEHPELMPLIKEMFDAWSLNPLTVSTYTPCVIDPTAIQFKQWMGCLVEHERKNPHRRFEIHLKNVVGWAGDIYQKPEHVLNQKKLPKTFEAETVARIQQCREQFWKELPDDKVYRVHITPAYGSAKHYKDVWHVLGVQIPGKKKYKKTGQRAYNMSKKELYALLEKVRQVNIRNDRKTRQCAFGTALDSWCLEVTIESVDEPREGYCCIDDVLEPGSATLLQQARKKGNSVIISLVNAVYDNEPGEWVTKPNKYRSGEHRELVTSETTRECYDISRALHVKKKFNMHFEYGNSFMWTKQCMPDELMPLQKAILALNREGQYSAEIRVECLV